MFIMNISGTDLKYLKNGKVYILEANKITHLDESIIDYNHLKTTLGQYVYKVTDKDYIKRMLEDTVDENTTNEDIVDENTTNENTTNEDIAGENTTKDNKEEVKVKKDDKKVKSNRGRKPKTNKTSNKK